MRIRRKKKKLTDEQLDLLTKEVTKAVWEDIKIRWGFKE